MFVKTKERSGRTSFYLCIAESGGSNWKSIEHSVCLGETLNLTGAQWLKIIRSSPEFRSVLMTDVLAAVERYVTDRGLPLEWLSGLRDAARTARHKKDRRNAPSDRRGQQDEREKALRVLGLLPGSSDVQVESAFRKAARRCHPDVGGDPARFRAIVDARNVLLGRAARLTETP